MSYEVWGEPDDDEYYNNEQLGEAISEATEELQAQLLAAQAHIAELQNYVMYWWANGDNRWLYDKVLALKSDDSALKAHDAKIIQDYINSTQNQIEHSPIYYDTERNKK